MSLQRYYSLRAAAKAIGVDKKTLKRWLEVDLAHVFPNARRGSKYMLRESDIEAVVRLRAPHADWTRIRVLKQRHSTGQVQVA